MEPATRAAAPSTPTLPWCADSAPAVASAMKMPPGLKRLWELEGRTHSPGPIAGLTRDFTCVTSALSYGCKMSKISGAESHIMEALWTRGALTAEEIVQTVGPAQEWGEATVKTL